METKFKRMFINPKFVEFIVSKILRRVSDPPITTLCHRFAFVKVEFPSDYLRPIKNLSLPNRKFLGFIVAAIFV